MPTGTRSPEGVKKQRILSREIGRRTRAEKRVIAGTHAGVACLFCGYADRLQIHRKDGEPHKRFSDMGLKEFKTHLESGQYVRLCFKCHKAVHWCMKHLKLSWKQIEFMWVGSIIGNAPHLQ